MNDKQLHKIIIESMDKVLNENEENEVFGINHGIRGAIQSAANGGKMWNGFKNGVKYLSILLICSPREASFFRCS